MPPTMTGSHGADAQLADASSASAGLDDAFPSLLVHTRGDKLDVVASVCASEQLGAVVCVDQRSAHTALRDLADRYVKAGAATQSLMLDASRYAGKRRAIGAAEMSSAWVRMQSNLGIKHPLTNSGYIPAGRVDLLRDVLRSASAMGSHVVAALPVANDFLGRDVDDLIGEVNAAGVAVGLMVEHANDPFGPRKNVSGLVKLLGAANVDVLLLRSDLSVIGALAWGARSGAFGTSTRLRHIYPLGKSGGPGVGRIPSVSAIVKDTLSLTRLEKIDDAIRRMPDPMWSCGCSRCYGRPLDWMVTETQAFEHSLSIVSVLAEEVLDDRLTPAERRLLWRGMCHSAQFRAAELDAETAGAWGDPPKFLGSWVSQVVENVTV